MIQKTTKTSLLSDVLTCLNFLSGICEVFGGPMDGCTLCFEFVEFMDEGDGLDWIHIHNTMKGNKNFIYLHIPFLSSEACELLAKMLKGKGYKVNPV